MKLVFSFFMAHAASQSIAIVAMLQLRMTLPHLQAAIAVHLMCEPFYSKGQQSLETFSLFAAAIMYHLGIMQKTAGNDSQLHKEPHLARPILSEWRNTLGFYQVFIQSNDTGARAIINTALENTEKFDAKS